MIIVGLFVLLLSLMGLFILVITKHKVEVDPATADVVKNQWSGNPSARLQGIHYTIPGIHEVLRKGVSLRNEAENPSNVSLVTKDGIELKVDFIIRRLQIGYPGMPEYNKMNPAQKKLLAEAVVKAVTAIDYDKRRDKVLTRVVACLQAEIEKRTLNQLIPGTDIDKGVVGKTSKEEMSAIESETNKALLDDIVTNEWGFWVHMDLEDYNLPRIIQKAREDRSAAEISGKAIADKAKAAGVDAKTIILADAVSQVVSNLFGNKNKENE